MKSDESILEGWSEGPRLAEMAVRLAEYRARGIHDRKYLVKLLGREFGAPETKRKMRDEPAPLAEALRGESKEEKDNIAAVRRKMTELLKVPIISRGAVMPDACPTGGEPAVIPVGGVIEVENAIIPSAHSADICCSLFATFYEAQSCVGSELDGLAEVTRFGPGGRSHEDLVPHEVLNEEVWGNPFLAGLRERAVVHMADQGDGNHFAFLGEMTVDERLLETLRRAGYGTLASQLRGSTGQLEGPVGQQWSRQLRVLVTHHGSRSLGAHLYKRGQGVAVKETQKLALKIPDAGAWLDARSEVGRQYWEALQYVGRWTRANHESIHRRFLKRIEAESVAAFGNEHNFVWKRGDRYLHGKGATPAWQDEKGRPLLGLIPLNMSEPILMVLGKGNEEFLSFAPHGAGRNLSRTRLLRRYPDAVARRQAIIANTAGIDVRWFCGEPDLSECAVAYKNAAEIRAQIEEFALAEIVGEVRPLGCIMAGRSGKSWKEIREEELTPKQRRQIGHRAERRRTRQDLSHWEE